jgi:hypothetical protein
MLDVVMPSVITPSVITPSVIAPSVITPCVVMLSVVAPSERFKRKHSNLFHLTIIDEEQDV